MRTCNNCLDTYKLRGEMEIVRQVHSVVETAQVRTTVHVCKVCADLLEQGDFVALNNRHRRPEERR